MSGPTRMVALLGTLLLLLVGAQFSGANFNFLTSNPLATASAADDFEAPTASRSVIAKGSGGRAGHVRQGGSYHVYAEVADSGNPSSGIGSVTADVSSVTPGASAVALVAGAYTVGGQTYNRRSAPQTAGATVSEGSKAYTLRLADGSVPPNVATASGYSVEVDNTQPTASSAVARVGARKAGKLAQGGSYHVYSNASDAGNPASGIDTLTADVSNLTTGQSSVALTTTNGPWTVDGVSYEYRSAQLTANATLSEGAKTHTVTSDDHAGNARTQPGAPASVDNSGPATARAVIAKGEGGKASFIREGSKSGSALRVYADVSDAGSPASGVETVTANLDTSTANRIVSNETTVPLTSVGGPFTVDGTTYTYRSASLTPNTTLAEGARSWTVAAADEAGNAAPSFNGTAVTVDNAAPIATMITATNATGTVNRPDLADRVTFTTGKTGAPATADPLDPFTVLPGWDGTSRQGTVTATAGEDFTFGDLSAPVNQAAIGKVSNTGDFIPVGGRTFGAGGTRSTLVAGAGTVTLTLGTPSANATTFRNNNTLSWTPSSGVTDRAGNPLAGTTLTEPGAADKDW